MIMWTGLVPCEFEFPFPDSLTSTFRNTKYQTLTAQRESRTDLETATMILIGIGYNDKKVP